MISLPLLARLSKCSCLCLDLEAIPLFAVTDTTGCGHTWTTDFKAAQCGNTCKWATLEGGTLQDEPTLREARDQGSRCEDVNVIEKRGDGNHLKFVKGDEKGIQGEQGSPRCMQAPFPPSRSWHNRIEEGQ